MRASIVEAEAHGPLSSSGWHYRLKRPGCASVYLRRCKASVHADVLAWTAIERRVAALAFEERVSLLKCLLLALFYCWTRYRQPVCAAVSFLIFNTYSPRSGTTLPRLWDPWEMLGGGFGSTFAVGSGRSTNNLHLYGHSCKKNYIKLSRHFQMT